VLCSVLFIEGPTIPPLHFPFFVEGRISVFCFFRNAFSIFGNSRIKVEDDDMMIYADFLIM